MADQLYFSRDTKVYLKQGTNVWALPILQGYSFSQTTNTSEVTLNEMADSSGNSRRARMAFNDSYSPAEFSFSMYARPFIADGEAVEGWEATVDNHHAVEEALWANFVAINSWSGSAWAEGITNSTSNMVIDFSGSNKTTLGEFELYFELGGCSATATPTIYKIDKCVLNSVNINFDIDGIATLEWSGMGALLTKVVSAPTITINEATTVTSNFIRNRLTSLTITASDTTTFPGASNNGIYSAVLTGGSISFENNISFLTPETLCVVNAPIGHVVGSRTIGGNFTCYLNAAGDGSSADFFADLQAATTTITNEFELVFSVGGSLTPRIEISIPQAHVSIPSIGIEDVISLSVDFMALPSSLDATDEATITYTGTTY